MMATKQEINLVACEVLPLIEGHSGWGRVPQRSAILTVLRSHKKIIWHDGIMRDIGIRISELKKELDAVAEESLGTITYEAVPEKMAILSSLRTRLHIFCSDGILKAISARISNNKQSK